VTLVEAAQVLGISKEAVRKRVSRGTLPSDVGEDGRRHVYLDAVEDVGLSGGLHGDDPRYELIATLRDQLEAEREANRENRRIIAALASRIPEIEAPSEPRESREGVDDAPDTTEPRSATEEQQEPTSREQEVTWWRRMFGG